ncbi:MAG: aromatic ring-hydroxylating dioxygenase subunit alpha [Nitrospinae bacterium]|nr:aromatic ring-hydroxylating dioxygenase subunit alpha [Nitrospinota bacterium]
MKTVMENKQWAKAYPQLGTDPVPAEPCISPAYFDLERERVFRRVWLNVGRVDEIPKAGDYVVRDLAVCNASILVMRGEDGMIRGFHNVCSHRGNKLVWDEKGSCRGYLTCNFHSWAYDGKGHLKWVPDEENFFGLQKREHGLTPVATDIWEGFIFINMKCRLRNVLQEDAKAHETLQAGLASRAKTHLLLQDDEIQIRYFHKVLEDYVDFYKGA